MATSGTYTFNPPADEIIEEAFDRVGIEVRGAYQLKTARRSLNLLLTEWSNRGINLWTISELTIPTVIGTATYTLSSPYIDIIDAAIRDSASNDTELDRISLSSYQGFTKKTTAGQPNSYAILRGLTSSTIYLWPTPSTVQTLVTWTFKYIEDAGAYTNTIAVPRRFLPALHSGLAYYIGMKTLELPLEKLAVLKAAYMEDLEKAIEEDRERGSLYIIPRLC